MIKFKELQQIGSGDPDIPKQMKKLVGIDTQCTRIPITLKS